MFYACPGVHPWSSAIIKARKSPNDLVFGEKYKTSNEDITGNKNELKSYLRFAFLATDF